MKKLNTTLSLATFSLLAGPSVGFAAEPCTATNGSVGLCNSKNLNLVKIVQSITNWALTFAGALAVLFIIYGGLQYITSAGNEKQAESAKQTLTYAVIGLVVVLLAEVIVVLVASAVNGALTTVK